jgi:hypothetical protein
MVVSLFNPSKILRVSINKGNSISLGNVIEIIVN